MQMTDKIEKPGPAAQTAAAVNAAAASGHAEKSALLPGTGLQASMADDGVAEAELTEGAQRLIGLHLKQLYGKIVAEPVPDEFLRLLDELEQRERET
jgi:Anti-sigma factor NepR